MFQQELVETTQQVSALQQFSHEDRGQVLDAVITIDNQGRVAEFNSAAQTIFGYRRADAVGRELLDLIVPPQMREQALAAFARHHAMGGSMHIESAPGRGTKIRLCAPLAKGESKKARMEA